jgi:uncharacterized protein YcfJ
MKKIVLITSICAAGMLFAEGYGSAERVRVTHYEPVYKTVTTDRPIKECWDETVERRGRSGGNDVVGGIVGGAIGGVLGNQVGQGSGKTAATIGGAIVGSMAGQNLSRGEESRQEVVQKCKTRHETESRQVVSGYNNYGTYKGKQIVKFSETPLDEIVVHTEISY